MSLFKRYYPDVYKRQAQDGEDDLDEQEERHRAEQELSLIHI